MKLADMTIPIHERFHAFQGEGDHMGSSAFFLRTFGCPLHCPWCDSAGTWHKDYVPEKVERLSFEIISNEVEDACPDFVVITGGEPAVQKNLPALCEYLKTLPMLPVHIETSGAFDFDTTHVDWITLSPKISKLPTKEMLHQASELKFIVDSPTAIDEWLATVEKIAPGVTDTGISVWLHPEWSKREDPQILDYIATWVKEHGSPFRAGWQIHKNYRVDSLDPRSRGLAPLGGNPQLGY